MPVQPNAPYRLSRLLRRLLTCLLAVGVGMLSAMALVLVAASPVRLMQAAPLADTITVTTSIQAAIDAALPGDTVFVPAGIYTESLTLSKAVSLTGELSTTTIVQAVAGQRVLTVTGAAVDSSVVISGLTFTGGDAGFGNGGGLRIDSGAQPHLAHLTVSGNQAAFGSGGGIYIAFGSPLRLTNVAVVSNTAGVHGGGVGGFADLTITGGLFLGNLCDSNTCIGGGLFAHEPLTLTDAQFIDNTSYNHAGGGAYIFDTATVVGGLFQGNQCLGVCTYGGGGLHANAPVTISGTQFLSNTATHSGGGVMFYGPPSSLEGALFEGNSCTLTTCTGGGVGSLSRLSITNTQFFSNTAQASGGGLYGGHISVSDSLFQDNACLQANCSGGGAYALGSLALTNTQFLSNTAAQSGGGAFVVGATTLHSGLFHNNQCHQMTCTGGALYAGNTITITNTKFAANAAQSQGGGVYLSGSASGQMVNALFAGNRAGTAGSALASNSTGHMVLLHTTITSPTLAGGNAIAVLSGTVGITNSLIASYTLGVDLLGGAMWEDYNLFAGVAITASGSVCSGGHSQNGPADFQNPEAGNYRLGPASAALNLGTDAGVALDFEDDARPQAGGFDAGYDERPFEPPPPDIALTISKSDNETFVVAGAALTYTIIITNAGADPAIGAVVSDTLPPGLIGAAWTCQPGPGSNCAASGTGSLSETITVAAGGALTFSLRITTTNAIVNPLVNTATVTAPDAVLSSASDATIVSPQVSVTITKTDGLTQVVNGGPLTYTLVLANGGPDPATALTVTDTLPAGLTGATWTCQASLGANCPASGSGGLAATISLDAGSAVTFTIAATTSVSETQVITNTATFSLPLYMTNTAPGPQSASDVTEVVVVAPAPEYMLYLPLLRR